MVPPYSNGNGYGYPSSPLPTSSSYDYGYMNNNEPQSICDEILACFGVMLGQLWGYINGRGRQVAWSWAMKAAHQIRKNMTRQRLLSFPHLLVALWILVMLWGERWVFASRIRSCDWDHWEDWVSSRCREVSGALHIGIEAQSKFINTLQFYSQLE